MSNANRLEISMNVPYTIFVLIYTLELFFPFLNYLFHFKNQNRIDAINFYNK